MHRGIASGLYCGGCGMNSSSLSIAVIPLRVYMGSLVDCPAAARGSPARKRARGSRQYLHVKTSRIPNIIVGVLGLLVIVASGLLFVRRMTPAVGGAEIPSTACRGSDSACGRRHPPEALRG
jgi:hypothetical protein